MATHQEIRAAVYDYYEKLWGVERVDEMWEENGETFALVSPARAAGDPPDARVLRCWIGETRRGGDGYGDRCCGVEDAECVQFEEVEFIDGTKGGTWVA